MTGNIESLIESGRNVLTMVARPFGALLRKDSSPAVGPARAEAGENNSTIEIAMRDSRDHLKPTAAKSLREFMESAPVYEVKLEEIADSSLRTLVEQYSTMNCRSLPMPDDKVLCKALGKYLMWVDAYDKGLSPHLIFQGYWEMWITAAIARSVRPGSRVIDVGANVGYYTLLLADAVGPHGHVTAFEPNTRLAAMLAATMTVNEFHRRVWVRSEAVAEAGGQHLSFAIPKLEPKNAGLVRNDSDRASFEHQFGDLVSFVEVPTVCLDEIGFTDLSVVKIDAEGGELDIWRGMQETIANNPDIRIFLEFNATRSYEGSVFLDEITRIFQLRYVDYDGRIKPLSREMIETDQAGSDWMLYLSRN